MPSAEEIFTIDRESPVPLYKQIEQWLRSRIASGILQPDEMLPSTKALCEQMGGINNTTVRQAIANLTRDGLLFAVQGRGTFVAKSKKRLSRVGLVLPNLDDELTLEIARGVQEVLDGKWGDVREKQAATILFDSTRDAQKEVDNVGQLQDLQLDGAIVMPICYGEIFEHLVRLKTEHFPLVLVDSIMPGIKFSSVTSDNYRGGYRVTEHLIQQGCQNIAWLGNCKGYSSAQQRFAGYRDALGDHGHIYQRKWTFEQETTTPVAPFEESTRRIVQQIVSTQAEIDGIVCANDGEAIACLAILRELGVSVPNRIAVTGFDDVSAASHSEPPLTTIHQPMREIGRQAANLLLHRLSDPDAPGKEIVLPVDLVIRSSSIKLNP